MAGWCTEHDEESFLYTHFEEICQIAARYDVSLSLGDGLRPGCIHDANDAAQMAELKTLGELNRIAARYHVQVMIEGPGHIPMHLIPENMTRELLDCDEATFTPSARWSPISVLATTTSRGLSVPRSSGIRVPPCSATSRRRSTSASPSAMTSVRERDLVSSAAHAADLAKGHPTAYLRDYAMSKARFEFRWRDQFHLALDPERAQEFHDDDPPR